MAAQGEVRGRGFVLDATALEQVSSKQSSKQGELQLGEDGAAAPGLLQACRAAVLCVRFAADADGCLAGGGLCRVGMVRGEQGQVGHLSRR